MHDEKWKIEQSAESYERVVTDSDCSYITLQLLFRTFEDQLPQNGEGPELWPSWLQHLEEQKKTFMVYHRLRILNNWENKLLEMKS